MAESTSSNDLTNGDNITNTETMMGGRFEENNSDILIGNNVKGTGMPENDTDKNILNADDKEIPQANEMKEDYVNSSQAEKEQYQQMLVEQICKQLTNVKEELKQEILEMRDHVANTVLKCVISSAPGPELSEENSYVTVEPAQNIQPAMLYSLTNKQINGLLCPAFHYQPRQYSVDSAMFSDYVPPSNSSVYA